MGQEPYIAPSGKHTFVFMNTRLTILLKKSLVERAKEEAMERGTSVSKFLEKLLENSLDARAKEPKRPTGRAHPDVDRLVGVLQLPKGFDLDRARDEYLREKFGA